MSTRRISLVLIAAVFGATAVTRADDIPPDMRRSGYTFMSPQTRAMQDDDTANPATLWVLDGEVAWAAKAGAANKACADCHGADAAAMKGVAARYPAFDATLKQPVNLDQRINLCRTRHQQAPALAPESAELLALSAFVGRQSRGLPIVAPTDERLSPFVAAGRALFHRRLGQLNLSCAQCHDDQWDKSLTGNPIQQGHPTGYPLYRLEWQTLGSLQRRLRNCMTGIRAEPYEANSPEFVALELFLKLRAAGMPVETPAVRP